METYAELSACRKYRYALTRRWGDGPQVLFVMLNPSTADEVDDDPTIGRCIGFAKSWGFGSLAVGNLFAFRTPSPSLLLQTTDPVGVDNDHWLGKLQASAELTVAAWGNHGSFHGRGKAVARTLASPHVLRLNGTGEPAHPLYIPADTRPMPWALSN
jgi:hypothetical protein